MAAFPRIVCGVRLLLSVAMVLTAVAPLQAQRGGRGGDSGAYKLRIAPNWFDGGEHFWYRNDLPGGKTEFVVVDARQGERKRAFDHEKLAAALNEAGVTDSSGDRLEVDRLEFKLADQAVEFRAGGKRWQCDLNTYQLAELKGETGSSAADDGGTPPTRATIGGSQGPGRSGRGASSRSPDGQWTASIKDNNVLLRAAEGEKENQLTTNGREGQAYGMLNWSPDSKTLVAFRI